MSFLAHRPLVVAVLDPAIRLQQADDWEIGRGLAVGHRAGLQDEPPVGPVGVGDLPDQT